METARRIKAKPTEHTYISAGRVYCPVVDEIRPDWMCAREHGDYHEVLDESED